MQNKILIVLAVLFVFGCQQKVDTQADVEAIEVFIQRIAEINNRGDATAWVNLFSEGAVLMPAYLPEITTHAKLEEQVKLWYDMYAINIKVDPVEIEIMGDWAFARYYATGTLSPKNGENPIPLDVKEIAIFKRQNNGGWKIYRAINNSNTPQNIP
jgi:ketosteroid isomerase-like protein